MKAGWAKRAEVRKRKDGVEAYEYVGRSMDELAGG
jgi:hypothetical protein